MLKNLDFLLKKPTVAFFFNYEKNNYEVALELFKKQVPMIAFANNNTKKNFLLIIDYFLEFNNNFYSLYFFCCVLIRIL